MMVFGTIREALMLNLSDYYIVNFNTLVEKVDQLMYLNPYRLYQYGYNTDTYEFDMWYMDYLINGPAFQEFTNLMRRIYNGENVWVLCDFSLENAYNVIETLVKVILEQYGYVVNIVKSPEDLNNLVEGQFSSKGIQFFDKQLENYIQYFGIEGLESERD